MHTDVMFSLVYDRQRRLLDDAETIRRARLAAVDRPPGARAATLRHDLGFRLVEAGLRLALTGKPKFRVTRPPP